MTEAERQALLKVPPEKFKYKDELALKFGTPEDQEFYRAKIKPRLDEAYKKFCAEIRAGKRKAPVDNESRITRIIDGKPETLPASAWERYDKKVAEEQK